MDEKLSLEELMKMVKEAGIVGAGGAGFPAYAKLSKQTDTLLLNCAECEPLLKLHRKLLESHAYEILSTLSMIADVLEANTVLICLKNAYRETIQAVEEHVSSFQNIQVSLLPEIYPAGDEVVMIYEATGKLVPAGGLPINIGITVFNVETIYNIYMAWKNNTAVTNKYVTVAGEVQKPCTIVAPIGMRIQELISQSGGAMIDNPVYVMGGPMTGTIVTKLDVVTKTTNAILVLPDSSPVVRKKSKNIQINLKRAMAACCQCNMCTDLCPRNLLGHPIEPHAFMRAATSGTTLNIKPLINTTYCSGCGVCEMYACMQDLTPRTIIMEYKKGLAEAGIKTQKIEENSVKKDRSYRQVPVKRLVKRLGLSKYDVDAPLDEERKVSRQVKIKLSQHIGAPSQPLVFPGETVKKGQKIANAGDGLSVPVHASISGVVTDVNELAITINWMR